MVGIADLYVLCRPLIFPCNVVFAEQPPYPPLQLIIDKKGSTISDAAFPAHSKKRGVNNPFV